MPQNLVEQLAQRHAVDLEPGQRVRAEDLLSIRPAHVMTHDNTGAVIPKFLAIGAVRMADPAQPVFALDHNVQDRSAANLAKYARIEAFAREMGVAFFPAGRGIGHQVMIEEGFAWPGTLVVASDSHSNMYGGVGCLGTPVVRTDAAAIWATGRTWWQVPPVARVELGGRLREGVTGKDLILTLCGAFNQDEVLNHAVEFCGEGVAGLSIEDRLAVANMTTEWGALAGVFPLDETLFSWLEARILARPDHLRVTAQRLADLRRDAPAAEKNAAYALTLVLDLEQVPPCVAGPNTVKRARPVQELEREHIAIQKAYLLSCVNGRATDLAQAAAVLRGASVAPGVSLYMSAASSQVQQDAEAAGDWQALVEAGAIALPPGCGPCIGLGKGLLEAGETGISATNRNFKGRMGHADAQAYLASPAVVAASAMAGFIHSAAELPAVELRITRPEVLDRRPAGAPVRVIEGFPDSIEGELVFLDVDNLNTDGIYAGKWTYQDEMGAAEQAAVVMENYDPAFRSLARAGDLLVGGGNFGCGSSREQAATALKHFGIRLVLALSFSETYKRNALNNGFLALECPDLVEALRQAFPRPVAPTLRTGWQAVLDVRGSRLSVADQHFPLLPIGAVAQELVLAGGLEAWVQARLGA